MKNPTRTLNLIQAGQALATIFASAAVAITVIELSNADLAAPLTLGGLLSIAAALAVGYAAGGIVDILANRAARPYRERLQDEIAEQAWPDSLSGESRAVAVSIQVFLNDLYAGLPCAVEMTGPGGRTPATGIEWISYVGSAERGADIDARYEEEASGGRMSSRELACRRLQVAGDRLGGERGRRIANRVSGALRLGRIDLCGDRDCLNCAPVKDNSPA